MREKRLLLMIFIVLCQTLGISHLYAINDVDTLEISSSTDTVSINCRRPSWIRQLFNNGFKINDPNIHYPRFAKFCVKVYNWGDHTFNQYDSTYVVSTGKNWKAFVRNDNWMEGFMLRFPENENIIISSNPYSDLGVSLCFMAVSIGYTKNAKSLFTPVEEDRQRFNFNFTSGLFSANIHYSSIDGGAHIRRFADYELPHSMPFNNITTRSFYADAYYFFNHKVYSQSAAYCFSRYQLKSAGTWLGGFLYTWQNIDIDFSRLPADMLINLPTPQLKYQFHYRSYTLAGGYAYNWVWYPRRWLMNVTVLPSVGVRQSYQDGSFNHRTRFASNLRGMLSIVYNHKWMFASVVSNFYGHGFFDDSYSFFNTTMTGSATIGVRF